MWKKIISLFLVLCMLTSLIGCGVTPQIVTDNGDNEEDFEEDLIEEEKDFNVIVEEGGIFELTDGAKVEIGANALNMDATLSFKKLIFNINKSKDLNTDVMYEITFTEQNVKILKSIKISLPIPSEIDSYNVAVIRFYNEDNYEIIEGYISSKSNSNFVTVEVEELGKFAVIEGDIDEADIIYKSAIDIVNVLLEAGGYYMAGDYDSLSLLLQKVKNEEQDALNILKHTPGLDWDEHGEEILLETGLAAATCLMGVCLLLFPDPILSKIGAVVSIALAVTSTIKIVKYCAESAPALLALFSYIEQSFKLKVVSYFYEKISLEVETSLANYNGPAPLEVEFTGFVSGGIAPYTYQWDFGDGNWSEEYTDVSIKSLHYIYEVPGEYIPVLHVEDNEGREGQAEAEKVVVSESNINGDITDVSPLTDPFTLDTWYTTYVYVENTGNTSHTFKVIASEPSGTDFEVKEKSITLSAGATNSVSFKYQFYGTETCRSLTFKLYDSSNNLLDPYTTGTLCPDTDLSAPTGVTASDGTHNNKVALSCNSVSGATHYQFYRATSSGGTKTALGSWQTGRTYDDFGASPAVTYYYFVRAATSSSGDNASPYSTNNTGWKALIPPQNVSATDGLYPDKVRITWTSVPGASYYRVYRATSSGGKKAAAHLWTPGTTE